MAARVLEAVAEDLTELAHPVAHGLGVHEQLGGDGVAAAVVQQPGPQGLGELLARSSRGASPAGRGPAPAGRRTHSGRRSARARRGAPRCRGPGPRRSNAQGPVVRTRAPPATDGPDRPPLPLRQRPEQCGRRRGRGRSGRAAARASPLATSSVAWRVSAETAASTRAPAPPARRPRSACAAASSPARSAAAASTASGGDAVERGAGQGARAAAGGRDRWSRARRCARPGWRRRARRCRRRPARRTAPACPASTPVRTAAEDISRQETRAPIRYAESRASTDRPLRASPRPSW